MTLNEFKAAFNVEQLNFYKSKSTDRYVASFGNDRLIITTVDFDHTKPGYVYDNPVSDNGYILSNKCKEAEFTL